MNLSVLGRFLREILNDRLKTPKLSTSIVAAHLKSLQRFYADFDFCLQPPRAGTTSRLAKGSSDRQKTSVVGSQLLLPHIHRTDVRIVKYTFVVLRNCLRSSTTFFSRSLANHERGSIRDTLFSLVGIHPVPLFFTTGSQTHSINSAKELIQLCYEIVDSGYSLSGSFIALYVVKPCPKQYPPPPLLKLFGLLSIQTFTLPSCTYHDPRHASGKIGGRFAFGTGSHQVYHQGGKSFGFRLRGDLDYQSWSVDRTHLSGVSWN